MKRSIYSIAALSLAIAMCGVSQAQSGNPITPSANWQRMVDSMLPLLGHRNWILIVDSAYPLQISPGVEVIETKQGLPEVTRYVLNAVDHSIHVRPDVYMDAELPFVNEADAPGVSRYRSEIRSVLEHREVTSVPHEQLLRQISEAGTSYKILILKTNETIPYTSVFLRLDCKYWSDKAETRLREAMMHSASPAH